MDSVSYRFSNDSGDDYAVEISRIKEAFLSEDTYRLLDDNGIQLWDIILIRQGWHLRQTPLNILSDIARCISDFYQTHQNAILYFQCDDLEDVPMSTTKREDGLTVQAYRSRLFSRMFDRQVMTLHDVSIINVPIYFEACDNDVYLHLMALEIYLPYIEVIKNDVKETYSK